MDTANVAEAFDGLKGNDHHDGGAVGVGDDAARPIERIGSVAFGHDQRHIGVHAESRSVVDHDSAVARDVGCKLLACVAAGAGESDVDVLEVVGVVAKFTHHDVLVAKTISRAGATARTEEAQFVDGKIAFGQYAKKFLAHGAAGAHDGYIHLSVGLK